MNKLGKLTGLIIILSYGLCASIYAYPYFFYRLLRIGDNNIIKVIDLIGDYNVPIDYKAEKPLRSLSKKLLKLDERNRFSYGERTLLATLRMQAQKKHGEPITLLWEDDGRPSHQSNKTRVPQTFMAYGSSTFYKEFARNQNKKIIFIPIKNVRSNLKKIIKKITDDSWSNDHVIVYAQRDACRALAELLEEAHHFKPIIMVGLEDTDKYYVPLSVYVWNFLKRPSQCIKKDYAKKGTYEHMIGEDEINNFFQAVFAVDQERTLSMIKHGRAAYVDLVNTRDNGGRTALWYAVEQHSYAMTQLLLHYGACPDIGDNGGNTPLHKAVSLKNCDLVELLLSAGACPMQKNNRGKSPRNESTTGIIRMLLDEYAKKWKQRQRSCSE